MAVAACLCFLEGAPSSSAKSGTAATLSAKKSILLLEATYAFLQNTEGLTVSHIPNNHPQTSASAETELSATYKWPGVAVRALLLEATVAVPSHSFPRNSSIARATPETRESQPQL